MKFARLLDSCSGDLPEMKVLFQCYKQLKKQLKQLPKAEHSPPNVNSMETQALQEGEARFLAVLSETLSKLDDRFLEREETCVIQLEQLQREAAASSTVAQKNAVYKRLIDFHGEVLLLVHWSVLAYTATVKILKKHHKRTGLLLRAPQLGSLLSAPFCSTEVMTDLARRAEDAAKALALRLADAGSADDVEPDAEVVQQQPQQQPQQQRHEQLEPVRLESEAQSFVAQDASRTHSISALRHFSQVLGTDSDDGAAPLLASDAEDRLEGELHNSEDLSGDSSDASQVTEQQDSTSELPALLSCAHDAHTNLVQRTQTALSMWENLKRTAITPSTVLPDSEPLAKRVKIHVAAQRA